MILNELTLQNFRSYRKQMFVISSDVSLIVGDNTTGKTNILEAIYYLATGKSFRAEADGEIISWNEEVCRLKATGSETKLEIVLTPGMVAGQRAPQKKYFVNGVARRMVDFVGNLKAVLFWPEHLELITDSPSMRRKYLDSVLVQIDREYRRNLVSYERGIRQRNRLLDLISEGKATRRQLLFWDQLVIRSGGYLTDARAAFIAFINNTSIPHATYHIIYDKSVISETRLSQYAQEEVAAKATLVGPHRDDMVFEKYEAHNRQESGGLDLRKYGSRGEQRLAILWLKLAEVSFIQNKTGERPMLLLDDIFSELDIAHRELVFGIIDKQQTIVTTTEEDVLAMLKRERLKVNVISLKTRT